MDKDVGTLSAHIGCTIDEDAEGVDVTHNYDQNLDDLSKEALVVDFLALLHLTLDLLPSPLIATSLVSIRHSIEEGLDEQLNESCIEKLIKLALVAGACQGEGHKGELKHVVLGFV